MVKVVLNLYKMRLAVKPFSSVLSQVLIHQSDNVIKNNKLTYNGAKNYQNFFHFSSFFAKISFKYRSQEFL